MFVPQSEHRWLQAYGFSAALGISLFRLYAEYVDFVLTAEDNFDARYILKSKI